ncbi:hypothetical protein HanRHA438_Chr10g0456191 [Helianthus annuus]|nr:hypothetical protein HanRHA438_Chr10g0456191 [Helianthus annuus]
MDKRDCDREAGLAAGIGSTNVYFRHSTLLFTGDRYYTESWTQKSVVFCIHRTRNLIIGDTYHA